MVTYKIYNNSFNSLEELKKFCTANTWVKFAKKYKKDKLISYIQVERHYPLLPFNFKERHEFDEQ